MVLDRYRIEHPIGRGGFGRIFLATQVSLNRKVAIKASSREHRDDGKMRERFRREAMLVASINHPHLVTYHEFGFDRDGDMLLVMEYLEGMSLFELAGRSDRVEPARATHWVGQASEGLHAAHEAGIVHRDVKPSNLFLVEPGSRRERLKVIDFGILRADPELHPGMPALTKTDHVIGTPAYLAPEMLTGGPVGGSADQYALALVTLELVTGCRVYGDGSGSDGLLERMTRTTPDLGPMAQGLPVRMRRVLEKALARHPRDRFPDILSFSGALEEAVQGGETASTRVEIPERSKSPRSGRPLLAAVAVALTTGGAVFGYQAISRLGSERIEVPAATLRVAGPGGDVEAVSSARRAEQLPAAFAVDEPRQSRKARRNVPVEKVPAAMTLNARPWAEVFVDGRRVGRTPIVQFEIPAGKHHLVFRHPNLGERSFRERLKEGQEFRLAVDFVRDARQGDPRGLQKQPRSRPSRSTEPK